MQRNTYRGYEINRGSYQGTTDDRLDRWYVEDPDATAVDRTGAGYATLAEAREMIDVLLYDYPEEDMAAMNAEVTRMIDAENK